jgi:iron complex outermembrane recepter protein
MARRNDHRGGIVVLLLGAAIVSMRSLGADAGGAAATVTTGDLEEIVVTATKREESLDKVPVSIVALSERDLTISGAKTIDQVAALSPSVDYSKDSWGGGASVISVRGVSSEVGESPTGIYIDDTAIQAWRSGSGLSYFGNPYPVTFDLNRVEVLRGPQGTLFGAGAEGGALRFIFNQPSLDTFSGLAREEVATTQDGGLSYESGLAVGGPIIDGKLGFRASAWYRSDGGFVNRVDPITGALVQPNSNGTDTKAFRLALTAAIGDGVTVTPSIYYQDTDVHDTWVYTAYLSNPDKGEFNNGQLLQQPIHDHFYIPTLTVNADLQWAKLTSISSYFSRDASTIVDVTRILGAFSEGYRSPLGLVYPTSYADAAPQPDSTKQSVFTQEIRLASSDPTARLTWVGGMFFSHRQVTELTATYSPVISAENGLPPDSNILGLQSSYDDSQLALFGQADYLITPKLKFTAGLRVARTEFNFQSYPSGLYEAGSPPSSNSEATEHPVTPKLILSYQADDANLFYVSAGKGYRVGGGNAPVPSYCAPATAPLTFNSDFVYSYEIGAKNRLFDDRVQINSSVYHLDWKGVQDHFLLPCGVAYIANSGSATSNGFDLAVDALLTHAWQVGFSVAYTDAKLNDNVSLDGYPIVEKGDAVGITPDLPVPWTLILSSRYDVPVSATISGYIWVQDIYHSNTPGPFSNDIPTSLSYFPELTANPATNVMNLRIGGVQGKLDVSLFLNNVLNSHPNLAKYQDTTTSTIIDYATLRPRTLGLTVNYNF